VSFARCISDWVGRQRGAHAIVLLDQLPLHAPELNGQE